MKILGQFFILLLLAGGLYGQERKPIHLAYTQGAPQSAIVAAVLKEAYLRAGWKLTVEILPPERAAAVASSGEFDGEVARVADYGRLHPELVRIDVPIEAITIAAFYKDSLKAAPKSVDDLKKYALGYTRGYPALQAATAGAERVFTANSREALFSMLGADRIEVAIESSLGGDAEVLQRSYPNISKLEVSRQQLYHYVRADEPTLIAAVTIALKDLQSSGRMAAIVSQGEADFINGKTQ